MLEQMPITEKYKNWIDEVTDLSLDWQNQKSRMNEVLKRHQQSSTDLIWLTNAFQYTFMGICSSNETKKTV